MWKYYLESSQKIKEGDYAVLPEFHATTSGLKAMCTWMAVNGIEEARQRCGGHGFLLASGISEIYMHILPACTYEGDNIVLCQQTCRYLLKAARDALSGILQAGNIQYLNDYNSVFVNSTRNSKDFLDQDIQLSLFRRISLLKVLEVYRIQQSQLQKGKSVEEVWNYIMPYFKDMTEAHCMVIMVRSFIDAVSLSEPNSFTPLKNLSDLFCLYNLLKLSNVLILDNCLKKKTH